MTIEIIAIGEVAQILNYPFKEHYVVFTLIHRMSRFKGFTF